MIGQDLHQIFISARWGVNTRDIVRNSLDLKFRSIARIFPNDLYAGDRKTRSYCIVIVPVV